MCTVWSFGNRKVGSKVRPHVAAEMQSLLKLSRCYSSAVKSQLAVLRKTTGFPISKCKQALSENHEDLEEAKKWLYSQAQTEGWAKVEKLRDRTANQGLIGLLIRGNMGAMVEVICSKQYAGQRLKSDPYHRSTVRLIL